MANALVLTASALGRTSQPSGMGAVLYVDGDSAVTIDAWPQPSRWIPEGVRLFRGDSELLTPTDEDGLRWVLEGDQRFGTFRATAFAGGTLVESAQMVVQAAPAVVLLPSAVPAASPAVSPTSGSVRGGQPGGLAAVGFAESSPGQPQGGADHHAPGTSPRGAPGAPAAVASPGAPPVSGPNPVPPGAPAAPAAASAAGPAQGDTRDRARTDNLSNPVRLTRGPASAEPPPGGRARPADAPAARLPAHASPEDIAAMVEVPQGEYDGRFAAWVGVLFTALTVAVLGFTASRFLGDPGLFSTAADAPSADATSPPPFVRAGNVAERIGLGTATLVLVLGAVMLLAGTALAALEVRGRLRHHPDGPAVTRAPAGGLRAVAVIYDRVSQPRAVFAVLVAGGVLLLIGFFGQLHWAGQV